ncbi:MAG: hypothetical protein H6738_17520 [Alphaproteobacteria bacterium]|nr:hypothetical protein [Alphaproteobacteria bacterium]MCB9698584.1 hypothetical protein [Alphaproteobacteria bacterium]
MTARRLTAAILALALAVTPAVVGATQRLGESPHGAPDKCAACHAMGPEGQALAPLPVEATCRGCHPDADMHPVGMKPVRIAVHEGWPLEDGVVTCATCHAEPGCEADRDETRPWLRGGTPARKADFCYRCHESQAMQRQSPHLPAGATDPTQAGCPACHAARPEPGATVAESRLRVVAAETCTTCHPGAVHAGVAEHVGHHVNRPPDPALPLLDGVIGCWTCHEVHAAPKDEPAPHGLAASLVGIPRDPGPEALLALPAADGSLCRACHGDGP